MTVRVIRGARSRVDCGACGNALSYAATDTRLAEYRDAFGFFVFTWRVILCPHCREAVQLTHVSTRLA